MMRFLAVLLLASAVNAAIKDDVVAAFQSAVSSYLGANTGKVCTASYLGS